MNNNQEKDVVMRQATTGPYLVDSSNSGSAPRVHMVPCSQYILTEYGGPSSCQLSSVRGNVEKGRSHMLSLLPGSPFEMRRSRPARMSTRFQEQVTPADIHRCSMTTTTLS